MNASSTNENNSDTLYKIKTSNVFYFLILIIVVLIIGLLLIFFKTRFSSSSTTSDQAIAKNVFIIVFFSLLICGLCFIFIPNFQEIKQLFKQIGNITYLIIYTIFLILFFNCMPKYILNTYGFIINIITIGLGFFLFYKSSKKNYIEEFNINYERIKSVIMLFCIITIFIIYYNIDPGGYIQKYFGYSLLLTIIITVFAFLYFIILFTLEESAKNKTNFLDNFTNFGKYGTILFLIFIVVMTILIATYPGGFFNSENESTSTGVIILLLTICILSFIVLISNLFIDNSSKTIVTNKVSLFKKSLLVLFGIIISSLIIFWIVYNIQNLSGESSIISFILNLLLVLIVLSLIYKIVIVKLPNADSNSKKNAFFELILNSLFYIPCLFGNIFEKISKFLFEEYNATNMSSILMLIFGILLFVIYFTIPSLFNVFTLQGGKQLVNNPVYTDTQYALGTYEELNGSDSYDYEYALSSWIFIDAVPPNMNSSYNTYVSLLNFAGKPNILYNGKTGTLMIVVQQKDLKENTMNNLTDFDENDNRIIYKTKNILLQKWNNIIINSVNGTMDIFINGELVKSNPGVVPYYNLDNLTIGENNGLKGGICNVVYFKKALKSSNIYYLYNFSKNKNPPVLNDSNVTIVKNNIATAQSSVT